MRQQERESAARADWERRRKRNTMLAAIFGVVAILVSLGYALNRAAGDISTAVASSLGPTTADVPPSTSTGYRTITEPLRAGRKPQVLMVGTLYCASCAAERWALVKALGRFGTWSNLKASTNGAGIPTFDLVSAGYSSWYISLTLRDTAGLDGRPLQRLSRQQRSLLQQYDPSGAMPLLIVGRYALVGAGVSPTGLNGRSFKAVQGALMRNRRVGYTAAINARANLITAMLCTQTKERPRVFCGKPVVRRIVAGLK